MTRLLLAGVLSLCAVGAVRAAPEPPEAPGVAPEIGLARPGLIEVIALIQCVVEKEVRENVGGRVIVRKVAETRYVTVHQMRLLPLDTVKSWTADGKPIDSTALEKRLDPSKTTPVLLARDGRLPGAAYRGLFRDDVLILALPAAPAGPAIEPGERVPRPSETFQRNLPDVCKAQVEGNDVVLLRTGTGTRAETRFEPKKVEGRDVLVPYRVPVPMTVQRIEKVNIKDVKGYGGDGKPLSAEVLADRLKERTVVLTTAADGPGGWSDKEFPFRALLRDETIVLVLP